jgi:hypothetical protein
MRIFSPRLFRAFLLAVLPGVALAQSPPLGPPAPLGTAAPAPSPATPPPAPAPAASSSAPSGTLAGAACTDEQQAKVKLQRGSIVRVQSGGVHLHMFDSSAGVLYPTSRHVVTRRSVLGVGRPLSVTFASGETVGAAVLGSRTDSDLVVLLLDREAPAPALALAPDDGRVGDTLLAAELDPEGQLSLKAAHVIERSEGKIRLDLAEATRGGAPLFDCEGRVVGLSQDSLQPRYVPAAIGPSLLAPPESAGAEVSLAHASVLGLVQRDNERFWLGMTAGGALTLHDRLELRVTVGFLGQVQTPAERQDGVKARGRRVQIESVVGYRMLLIPEGLPVYLVPTAGVVTSWDWNLPGSTSAQVRPTFGARLQAFPVVTLGYGWQPGLGRAAGTTHQFSAGLEF